MQAKIISVLHHGTGNEVHGRRSDESGHKEIGRVVIHVSGRIELLHNAVFHDGDAVGQRHGLDLVMGHIHDGGGDALMQKLDFRTHLHAQLGIQVAQRFVEKENRRATGQCPAHGHPLSLPTGKLGGFPIQKLFDLEHLRDFLHSFLDLRFGDFPGFETERDVFPDVHVRIESVGLKDHGDVPVLGAHPVYELITDINLP